MMNNEMMRQLQARMVKLQEDLASQTVEASAGGGAVTVTISEIGMGPAQAKVQRVKIAPEAVDPEDIETLEDLIVAAVNEALSKAQKAAADKLGPLTGGMKLPGMPRRRRCALCVARCAFACGEGPSATRTTRDCAARCSDSARSHNAERRTRNAELIRAHHRADRPRGCGVRFPPRHRSE